MVRSELAYYVPTTLNRRLPVPLQKRHTVPAYRTSSQKFRHTVRSLRTVQPPMLLTTHNQGWQYGTVRSEFAY